MYCQSCGKEVVAAAKFCPDCGAPPLKGNSYCNACGAQVSDRAEVCAKCGAKLVNTRVVPSGEISSKSKATLIALCWFLGTLGIHRLYAGKKRSGIAMLIIGLAGYATIVFGIGYFILVAVIIWNIVDFIFAVLGKFKDKEGKLIKN